MTFEVGETINKMIDSFLRAPIIYSIARNPIYTALVITLVILLIVAFIFREIDSDESLLVMTLRTGFWVFIMMLGVLMLHNRVLTGEDLREKRNGSYDAVFGTSVGSKLDTEFIPIAPSIYNQKQGGNVGGMSNTHNTHIPTNIPSHNPAHIPSNVSGVCPGTTTCELSKPSQ